jgi:hypothetical protein
MSWKECDKLLTKHKEDLYGVIYSMERQIDSLRWHLNRLIHACEDEVDDYVNMQDECDRSKKLLPNYRETRIFIDQHTPAKSMLVSDPPKEVVRRLIVDGQVVAESFQPCPCKHIAEYCKEAEGEE